MNRPTAGPQALRNVSNNVFQNQQPSGPRSNALGSARLQNGKLGSGSGWGFPGGLGNASGAQTPQARPTTSSMTSFAQTIGGAPSQSSLDPSEFPSLSGAPQAQQQNPSAIWSNPNLRGTGNQRQPGPAPSHPQQSSQPSSAAPGQQRIEPDNQANQFPSLGQAGSGVDDLRYDERVAVGRGVRNSTRQSSGDDFPPLGGLGDGDLRQAVASQNRFNGNGGAFGPSRQQSGRAFNQVEGHLDGLAPPTDGSRMVSPANTTSAGQSSASRQAQSLASDTFTLAQRGPPPGQQRPSQPSGSSEITSSPTDGQIVDLQSMSESDRWGLAGFMAQLRSGNQDQVGLMLGIDLNTLGFDLHRPEPLWPEWPGPSTLPRQHPIVPDFRLPAAYSVHNVPPLHTKIASFSDETLFAIFYGNPRDMSQELAANELYSRDWRWHKKMQQWMMKAKEFGEPVQLPSNKEERGWYYFFDVHNWRRERKEFILNYEHLYHGHAQGPTTMP